LLDISSLNEREILLDLFQRPARTNQAEQVLDRETVPTYAGLATTARALRPAPLPRRRSALDQVGGADRGGEGAGVAGAREHVGRGVGEFDHVFVAVLDRPGERLLGCLPRGNSSKRAM
jgi:hypothetical protein